MKKTIKITITSLLIFSSQILSIDQFQIEQFYTNLAQKSLDQIMGENKFIVRAKVELSKSKYRVTYTKEAKIKTRKKNKTEKVYLMPGYPALKNISPDNLKQLPYNSITTLVDPKIKKTTLTIFANKSVSRLELRKVKPLLQELLSLKTNRDIINVKYKTFFDKALSPPQPISIVTTKENYLSLKNIINALLLFVAILFLFAYIRNSKKKIQATKNDGNTPTIHLNPNIELPNNEDSSNQNQIISLQDESKNIEQHFKFINNNNVKALGNILLNEKVMPEYVAIIMSYLNASLSQKIMKNYPIEIQSKIIETLIDQKQIKKEMIEKIESKIKKKLEGLIGGKEVIEKILSKTSTEFNQDILKFTESKNEALYQKLRPYISLIEDISHLNDQEIKNLIASINIETLAKAICKSDTELIRKLEIALPEGGKEMLKAYINANQKNISKSNLDAAQKTILKEINKLKQDQITA
eukprot:SAG22_NODE_486_length_9885_cov_2.043634_7_plen_469_part_00